MSSKQKNILKLKVAQTLTESFSNLQEDISPKKFKRTIKKATKVILSGLKQSAPKKPAKAKEAPVAA